MRGDDRLDEGESQSGAALAVARGVAAGEPLEGVVDQLRREARTVVVDGEPAGARP